MKIRWYLCGAVFCISSFANACSCIEHKIPMSEILAQNDLVFAGKVVKKSKDKWINTEFYNIEFQQIENYKGVAGLQRVAIKTGANTAMCGFSFEEGETYLVFAYKFPVDEKQSAMSQLEYGTGLCSQTKAIKYAKEDVQKLKKIQQSPH